MMQQEQQSSEHRPSAEPPIVQSHQTENAAEFIDAIHDLAGNLGTEVFSGWRSRICYRGVASVAHRLVPTALRPKKHGAGPAARFRVSDLKNKPQWRELTQIHLEFGVLAEFCRFAHQSGLPLPTFEAEFTEVLREPTSTFKFFAQYLTKYFDILEWPHHQFIDGLALAQHYNLPTRLLDWTRDIFTAAYFAASHAMRRTRECGREETRDERLAVWGFFEAFANMENVPLIMPMPPYHGNPNLSAQRGIFTLWRPDDGSHFCDDRPLTNQIHDWLKQRHRDLQEDGIFRRIDLPAREAPNLMLALMKRGYDAARLFPGYGGAAKAVEEQALAEELIQESAGGAALK
jgi:hypothetical protein